ncbi:hypothetical protein ACQPZ8_28405 [Actinomadura nitritigenes]|uniref:hypothetical protein n=1 Tax=Actinomadura nitritigenes TaxID=134602 RepID=UPI003D8F2E24
MKKPDSLYGRFLGAIMTGDLKGMEDTRARAVQEIPPQSSEGGAVAEHVFNRVVSQYFTPATPVAEISRYVIMLNEMTTDPLNPIDAEMVIRRALGEVDVSLVGLSAGQIHTMRAIIAGDLARRMKLQKAAVYRLIIEAERNARAAGVNLTPF